MKFNLGS
ncbi:hypothetical protein LINPERHAP2_LOCUS36065 [Linum perenne]